MRTINWIIHSTTRSIFTNCAPSKNGFYRCGWKIKPE